MAAETCSLCCMHLGRHCKTWLLPCISPLPQHGALILCKLLCSLLRAPLESREDSVYQDLFQPVLAFVETSLTAVLQAGASPSLANLLRCRQCGRRAPV